MVRESGSGLRGKKNKIVRLYRRPPRDGIVVCVDELGPLATIPRGGRSWGKKPQRRSDRYHKSQTIQMLGACAPHTGEGMGLPHPCKTGEAVLAFLQTSNVEIAWTPTNAVNLIEPSAFQRV